MGFIPVIIIFGHTTAIMRTMPRNDRPKFWVRASVYPHLCQVRACAEPGARRCDVFPLWYLGHSGGSLPVAAAHHSIATCRFSILGCGLIFECKRFYSRSWPNGGKYDSQTCWKLTQIWPEFGIIWPIQNVIIIGKVRSKACRKYRQIFTQLLSVERCKSA